MTAKPGRDTHTKPLKYLSSAADSIAIKFCKIEAPGPSCYGKIILSEMLWIPIFPFKICKGSML